MGAYIWLVERHDKGTTERQRTAHLLLTLDPTRIDVMKIKRPNDTVVLKKDAAGDWFIAKPILDRAESGAAKAILALASEFEISRVIPQQEIDDGEVKPVDLGLDADNAIELKFHEADKLMGTLMIGNAAPWDDSVYCRVQGDSEREEVYVAATPVRPILSQPVEAFRDTRLLGLKPGQVITMAIQQGNKTEIELQRASASPDSAWLLSKPLRTQASKETVDKMLERFLDAQVESFSTGDTNTAVDLSPEAVVVSLRTIGGVINVTLQPPSDESTGLAQARTSDRKGTFAVDDEYREMFTALDENTPLWQHLRSRSLGRVNPSTISTIVVRNNAKNNRYDLPVWLYGQAWYMTRNGVTETADKASLLEFVSGLNNHEILEFTSDSGDDLESFGLAVPRFQIDFAGGEHHSKSSPPSLDADRTVSLLIGQSENNSRMYAKYAHEPFVYQISPSILEFLPLNPIEWKNRLLLAYSQSAIQAIVITRGTEPPVEFRYDSDTAEWTAKRSGEDISHLVDVRRIEERRSQLAAFYAERWASDFRPKDNLKQHTLKIALIVTSYENDQPETVTRVLRFVGTDPNDPDLRTESYFGDIDNIHEPFVITRKVYEELYDPLLKEEEEGQ